jgi:Domain of unknown function (DUF2019)
MKKTEMRVASTEALVRRYEDLAAARGAEFEHGSVKVANTMVQEQATIRRELDRRGSAAWRLLLPLLQSANPWVRLDAAIPALFFASEEAEPALEELATRPRALGFTAEFTLQQWRKGELKPSWRASDAPPRSA